MVCISRTRSPRTGGASCRAAEVSTPASRTVDDIITDPGRQDADHGAAPERLQGPKDRSKWLCRSVTDTAAQVVSALFDQAEHSDPAHRWVVLVDGARDQIDLFKAEALQRGVDVHIIVDLIHVLECLWRAAWSLHDSGDASAESWVARHARVLGGGEQQTAAALEETARAAGLREARRMAIDEAVNYLSGKVEYVRYEVASRRVVEPIKLAESAGRGPIASSEALLEIAELPAVIARRTVAARARRFRSGGDGP
ncbi:hypothetical protein [Streptomyces sp. NPDC007856]|uniref:hypothetical protein n=1 Tax=Streptomyces sp. NPDC007856 TaxID=3364781 RepID=UPI0036868547